MKLTDYARDKLAIAYRDMIGDGARVDLYDDDSSEALATFACGAPCGEVEKQTLWLEFSGDATAERDATPKRAVLVSGSGQVVAELTVGGKGSGADFVINPPSLLKNGPVRCDGFAISCRAPRGG